MPDTAAPQIAHPSSTKRGGGSIAIRVIVAAVVVGGIVWFVRSRHHERTASSDAAAAGSGRAGGSDRAGGPSGAGGGSGENRVVTVQVAAAARKDLPIWLEGLGTVAAMQQVIVRPQVDGKIDKVAFTEGQMVKRGDLLMQIDPRPFIVSLHQAQGALERDKAQLVTNQANLKRYQGLLAQNLVASQQVEEVAGMVGQFEGSVKMDQAQIENAQLQLDYASVRSPLDGITGVRQIDAGNLIHQTDANGIVVITAIDPAAVFFTVPQDQLSAVVQALAHGEVPVEVMSRDGATKLATGKLAVLDNQINQTTATLRLKALVPNPNRLLWPNAFVKARMLVEIRKDAIVIPTVAVQRGPQGTYVYAVGDDQTAQMRPVTVALTTGEVSVIAKGLGGGEQVIIEGQNQVRPGGRVQASTGGGGGPAAGAADGSAGSNAGPRGHGKHRPGAGSDAGSASAQSSATAAPEPAAAPGTSGASGSGAAPVAAPATAAGTAGTADTSHAPANQAAARPVAPSRSREPATGPTASNQPVTP
ncbi:MAG TPA: efflux RND transporter periplasmic adaptor subunit [Kofleriaceae bacterium]|jgi:multidrug efflux system membrane fusion protein|nr:efflux RND transporter periplasmic adaptor subunit [Kofleriaceae bacterium]